MHISFEGGILEDPVDGAGRIDVRDESVAADGAGPGRRS